MRVDVPWTAFYAFSFQSLRANDTSGALLTRWEPVSKVMADTYETQKAIADAPATQVRTMVFTLPLLRWIGPASEEALK